MIADIGAIKVPRMALRHPHVAEALACAIVLGANPFERVVGTDNKQIVPACQLYGWGPNVFKHRDATGFIYFSPLRLRRSWVHTNRGSAQLQRGRVYRLFDYVQHWTRDSAAVVCLFIGPYQFPQDAYAIEQLQVGAARLAADQLQAPRVSPGFRVPLRGECYALVEGKKQLVQIATAALNGWLIARCALCNRIAVKVDRFFPFHQKMSRCAVCLTGPYESSLGSAISIASYRSHLRAEERKAA